MDPSFLAISQLFQGAPSETPSGHKTGRSSTESRELGETAMNDGLYTVAIDHFKRAIEQASEVTEGDVLNLAGAYEAADQLPEAFRQYERAVRLKAHPEAHLGLTDLYRRYGRYRDALEELQKAIDLNPENAFHHFKLAETLKEIGERKKALVAIDLAIVNQPEHSFYHYWKGDLLLKMKRPDDALKSFRAAIELSPGDDFLYLRAAVAFWQADRKADAIRSIRLSIELDPEKTIYNGLLAALLEANGQIEDAVHEQERADKMDSFDRAEAKRVLLEMGLGDADLL